MSDELLINGPASSELEASPGLDSLRFVRLLERHWQTIRRLRPSQLLWRVWHSLRCRTGLHCRAAK